MPTARATTLVNEPSWVSLSAHSALRKGKTAESTCRDMSSDSRRPKVRRKTIQG